MVSAAISPARRTNVAAWTGFIGRKSELDTIARFLSGGERLITVTGPGGIGKTRLVTQHAALHADEFADGGGAWLCDLTDARDLDGLCRAVGEALDIPLTGARGSEQVAAQIGHAIAGRGRVLLVLDNFEQLVEHARASVGRWLRSAPGALFVVTSRELLRLGEEQAFELPPLAVPREGDAPGVSEAVQLFVDRVRRLRGEYVPADRDAMVIAEIVRQLDGIPLAIELAAARMNALGPSALLERLSNRLDVLARGSRGAEARQSTMRGAIEWSWNLLAPHEQDALAQCSVFRGGFDLTAAERVIDLSAHPAAPCVLDTMQALREKSLLRGDHSGHRDSPRFGLYLTIREFAAERLGRSKTALRAAETRHTAHFVPIAERWSEAVDERDGLRALESLALERENVAVVVERALADDPPRSARVSMALRAMLALDVIASLRGPVQAHVALLDRTLASPVVNTIDPRLHARSLVARGNHGRRLGRMTESVADLQTALSIAIRERDRALEARALDRLGICLKDQGKLVEARDYFERALSIHREQRNRRSEGLVLGDLGDLLREIGDSDAALPLVEASLAIIRESGSSRLEALTLTNLANIHMECGRGEEARRCYELALSIHRQSGDRRTAGGALGGLGAMAHGEGRPAEAITRYEAALEMLRQVGDRRFEGIFLGYLGIAHLETNDWPAARRCFERAREILREASDPRYEALFLAYLAGLEVREGNLDLAASAFDAADALAAEKLEPSLGVAMTLQRTRLDLALALRSDEANDRVAAAAHRQRARERAALAGVSPDNGAITSRRPGASLADRSIDVRIALRLVPAELNAAAERAEEAAQDDAVSLRVDAEGRWFQPPSGERVECGHLRAPRRLLVGLVEHRVRTPGGKLSRGALVAVGWPDEKILEMAARARLHVALSTLRKLGLRDLLRTEEDGYLLDPEVPVRWVRRPPK